MIAEYYEDKEKVLIAKVEHIPFFEGGMFGFFILFHLRQLFRCRSPPSISLILSISIDWRKDKWLKCQREIKARTILII